MALKASRPWRVALAGLAIAAALAGSAGAADVATGPVEVIRLTLQPGREAEAERFLEALADAARRTRATTRWRTLRRTDGELVQYVVVLQARDEAELEAWAAFNPSEVLARAFGADRAQEILALREASLARVERERLAPRPDLGFDGAPAR